MEEYLFRSFIDECSVVSEATSYVEIFNYADSSFNSCEQHALEDDEFNNFLNRAGAFAPPEKLGWGNKLLSGIRLVVQMNARDPDTFTPKHISLPKERYVSMVQAFSLPYRGIETSAVVGPFFWSGYDQDDKDPHLHIIHRKSDVRKKGMTRGWEMMLSHSFKTSITTGYIKGTPSSEVVRALEHLKACAPQIAHPMVLSTILLSHDLSPGNDAKQRDARDWLRHLENAVSLRDEVEENAKYFQDGMLEIDGLSRDLVECHGNVMWKRPQAYYALCLEMDKALDHFKRIWGFVNEEGLSSSEKAERKMVGQVHESMSSRIDFYKAKLKGLENYIHTTLERLKVQREALYNITSQREARLNLQIAGEQRRIAHASKRDSTAMKTLSFLGAVFLPGTYLASVFGMSFFNFEEKAAPVSVKLWIYFAITVPITVLIVISWMWFDRRREAQHRQSDKDLEEGIGEMERKIMADLRKKTIEKRHTFKSATKSATGASGNAVPTEKSKTY